MKSLARLDFWSALFVPLEVSHSLAILHVLRIGTLSTLICQCCQLPTSISRMQNKYVPNLMKYSYWVSAKNAEVENWLAVFATLFV